MSKTTQCYLVTVVLADRVGILRDVTGVLYRFGGNIMDVRQNVLGGQFLMNAVVAFEAEGELPKESEASALQSAVAAALPEGAAAFVNVRVSAPAESVVPAAQRRSAVAGERYVAAFTGPDRPGRIYAIAEVFARYGVNVEDWRHDLSVPARTLTIGVVTVPPACDLDVLREELTAKFGPEGLAVSILHENIFRATNEVGPIEQLLGHGAEGVPRNA